MLSKEKIARINQLYKKAKSTGLTKEEQAEQQALRKEYIQSVRSSLKSNLMQIKIVDQQGTDITPTKLKQEQAKRKKH